jgi:protein-L-isoaspartate(D-aspartate) O-methyltransferase
MVRDHLGEAVGPDVVEAMAAVPRHAFVPDRLRASAYDDAALGIGGGATISQPRVVARMLDALALRPGDRVCDIGAGSGYAAALIARLVAPGRVLAVERLAEHAAAAVVRLAGTRVQVVHGDALAGLGTGPWDAIHVACACAVVPACWLDALAPGGRLVAPVGPADGEQRLLLYQGGTVSDLGAVRFVPALAGSA